MTSESQGGWTLVAALFLVLALSSGFGFYNLSVYMTALADARGYAVADLSLAVSLFFVVGGIAGIGVATLISRFDARWVMAGGALLGGAALSLVGSCEALWQLYVLYALFGIGNAGVALVPATTLVTRWFDRARRSLALSVASTGLSVGGVLLTPASALVLERLGLAAAMPWFGLVYGAGIVAIALLLVRSWPGGTAPSAAAGARAVPGTSYRTAVRSRFFALLTAAFVLLMASQVGGIAHLFNRGTEIGSYAEASFAVSLLAMCSIAGRLLGGFVVMRFSTRAFTLANIVGQVLGLTVLAGARDAATLWIGAALFGATVGNLLMLRPLLLAEGFGVRDYPRIFSLSEALTTAGVAAGPLLIGIVHDANGYALAYMAVAASSCIAFALLALGGQVPEGEPVVRVVSNEVDMQGGSS